MTASSRRGSLVGALALAAGAPLGIAILWLILHGPGRNTSWRRYFEHPVEQTEVMLFCCAVTALAGKLLAWRRERAALSRELVPRWNGQTVPASDAKKLRAHLHQNPPDIQRSYLGQRVANVLDFVQGRGSANELDDQMRTLADNDAIAQDSSFSLLRLIIWAIPILGFLGTVVGITGAIAGVTPETLEQSLSGVTQGLSTAFDATALALFLTMIVMIFTFAVERLEQNLLTQVDAYVDVELAHRFERTGSENGPILECLRRGGESLLHTADDLIRKQVELWGQSFARMEQAWSEAAPRQFQQMQQALELALEATLTRHGQQLRQTEDKLVARTQVMLDGLTLASEKLRLQAGALKQLQENEAQLARLHEAINNSLAAVANTGAFDQAVQSLTAAIHLMTTRASPGMPPRAASNAAA